MSLTPQQTKLFNLYVMQDQNTPPPVANYLGNFQLTQNGTSITLTYTPGGACTLGGAGSAVFVPVTDQGNGTFTTGPIGLGQTSCSSMSFAWDNNAGLWRGTAVAGSTTLLWSTPDEMVFPYGDYLFMVYDTSKPRGSQHNDLGGTMTLSTGAGNTNLVQITVGVQTAIAQARTGSTQLNFGNTPNGVTITLPDGVVYNFGQLFYAFTDTDGRAILWGRLQTSNTNGSLEFVAIQWTQAGLPGLPGIGWTVSMVNTPNTALGTLNLNPNQPTSMTFTPPNGQPLRVTLGPGPKFVFSDAQNRVYTGMAQVTVNGANGGSNPSSHPKSLTWNFGGLRSGTPGGADDWSSVAENGQPVITGLAAAASAHSRYA
jgi:hypothetical protein